MIRARQVMKRPVFERLRPPSICPIGPGAPPADDLFAVFAFVVAVLAAWCTEAGASSSVAL